MPLLVFRMPYMTCYIDAIAFVRIVEVTKEAHQAWKYHDYSMGDSISKLFINFVVWGIDLNDDPWLNKL